MKLILSIDGGGIRGLIPATVLAEVGFLPEFDLMVGTSTGGIIALGLAAGFSPREVVEFYLREAAAIFPHTWRKCVDRFGFWRPRYPAAGIEAVLARRFGDLQMGEAKQPVAVTSALVSDMSSVLWTSWDNPDVMMRRAARATSAAPTYFPLTADGHMDGGVWANNPSLVALTLAKARWQDEKEFRVLSLGTGRAERYVLPRRAQGWGVLGLLPHLPRMLTSTGEDFAASMSAALLGPWYMRVQPSLEAVDPAMDRVDQIHLADLMTLAARTAATHRREIAAFLLGASR